MATFRVLAWHGAMIGEEEHGKGFETFEAANEVAEHVAEDFGFPVRIVEEGVGEVSTLGPSGKSFDLEQEMRHALQKYF